MENKITPTPWEVGGGTAGGNPLYIYCDDVLGSAVCKCNLDNPNIIPLAQQHANASAIVSAVNNTWGAGVNPEVVPALLKTLEQIAAWPGNLEDDLLTSRTGPNDAAARGLMVVAMRSFAKAAIEKAKLPTP